MREGENIEPQTLWHLALMHLTASANAASLAPRLFDYLLVTVALYAAVCVPATLYPLCPLVCACVHACERTPTPTFIYYFFTV